MAAGTLTSQACVYLLNIVATRSLGPAGYGEFASLLTLTVILSIPALSLQSWTARTTAQGADASAVLRTTAALSLIGAVATVGVVLLLGRGLDTDPLPAALATALLVAPMAWLSAAEGFLQGSRRLRQFATVILCAGAFRLVAAVATMVWADGAVVVVAGVGVATLAVAAGAWTAVGGFVPARRTGPAWRPVLRIAAATGAIWVIANVDIVVARVALPNHESGLYAVGAMIARAVQFAPQFVALSVFAALTDAQHTRRVLVVAATKLATIGLAATGLLAVVGAWLVPLVFGADFEYVGEVAWLFGVIGTLLALNQLLVAQRIARHDEVVATVVWLGAVALTVGVLLWSGSVLQVALAALAANAVVASLLAARCAARP